MKEIYALALMLCAGFPVEDEYRRAIDEQFSENDKDADLLYLEFEPDLKTAMLYVLSHFEAKISSHESFGKCFMEKIRPFYTPDDLAPFTKKLYNLWRLLPEDLAYENPFHIMNYADDFADADPEGYYNPEQCRELCEEMLNFYEPESIGICDECGSKFLKSSSEMSSLCPECAHILYGYENCDHVFKHGKCVKCLWNGKHSKYIKKLIEKQ